MKSVSIMKTISGLFIFFIFVPFNTVEAQEWSFKKAPIETKWAKDVDPESPLPEYPRPQMERSRWMNLNGLWAFKPGQASESFPNATSYSRKILVPFPVESALSGVMENHERLWYKKEFNIPTDWKGDDVLIHFGAIDWESEVFLNGKSIGIHQGGYDEITYNITPFLKKLGKQEIVVRVYDPTEKEGFPRGKQEHSPHGLLIMYTPVTGIWQTVWLEPVKKVSIKRLKITPDVDQSQLHLKVETQGLGNKTTFYAEIKDGSKTVATATGNTNEEIKIAIKNPKLWSPDSPFLYDLNIILKDNNAQIDVVKSYFGMRKVSLQMDGKYQKIFLNNKFVYNLGFLDQGFWPEGVYTAPTDDALKYDVQIQKDFGYNMVRKHIKVEPQRWYYWADKLGIMVWQDMPSANSYKHNPPSVDTAQYRKELEHMVDGLYNSPSIITWVLFNETQGQKANDGTNLTTRMYNIVKAKDPTRLINPASDNIYKDYIGDILDYHSYPGPKSIEHETMATACGEFGSVGLAIKNHEWLPDSGVSGLMVKSALELEETYRNYINQLLEYKTTAGMSGAVFTQLTDVEQEINGFLTYDRFLKVDVNKINSINNTLIKKVLNINTIIPFALVEPTNWKYTFDKPTDNWKAKAFNDQNWKTGKSGFGNGTPPNSKTNTSWTGDEIWLRKIFKINRLKKSTIKKLYLKVYHDEDIEIYINGILAASAKGHSSNYITMQLSPESLKALNSNGENTMAVYCRQTLGGQMVDVGLQYSTISNQE